MWALVGGAGRRHYPDDPTQWAPEEPMSLHIYNYAKRVYLKPLRYEIGDVSRLFAASQAVELGCCVERPGVSWTHPEKENCLYSDGKVITARSKKPRLDKETGEIRRGCDPDFEKYTTGGGQPASGVRFALVNTRLPDVNERIILDVIGAPLAKGRTGARDDRDRAHSSLAAGITGRSVRRLDAGRAPTTSVPIGQTADQPASKPRQSETSGAPLRSRGSPMVRRNADH